MTETISPEDHPHEEEGEAEGGADDQDATAAAVDLDPLDPVEKEAQIRAELALLEQTSGPEDVALIGPLAELSGQLLLQSRYAEAEAEARRALAIVEKAEGVASRRAAVFRKFLCHLLSSQRRYAEAEELLHQVLAYHRQTEGRRCPAVAALLGQMADLRQHQGQSKEARVLYRRALRMMSETGDRLDRESIDLLISAAHFYDKIGDYARSVRAYRRVLRRCARAEDPGSAQRQRRARLGLVAALHGLADEHLRAGRQAEALVVVAELIEHAPAQGYPLAADMHEEAGDPVQAQRVLEAGTRALPRDGRLWGQLGDLYARQGLLGDAARAYDQALSCPDVDEGRVRYRAGLNSSQRDCSLEAISHLEQVRRDNLDKDETHLLWRARGLRLLLLKQVGRTPEVMALAGEVLADLAAAPSAAPAEESASLVCLGRALLYLRGDRAAAQACAVHAFRQNPESQCLCLLREIKPLPADGRTRCLRVTITGRRPDAESGADREFSRTYLVVAESLDEALTFIRPLEAGEGAGPIPLQEWTRLDIPPVGLRGVHSVGAYRPKEGR